MAATTSRWKLFRGFLSTLSRGFLHLTPSNPIDDDDSCKLDSWASNFIAPLEANYDIQLQYAKDKLTEALKSFEVLNGKAQTYFTLSASLAGLLFTATGSFKLAVTGWLVGALACFGVAMLYALLVTAPADAHSPMAVQRLVELPPDQNLKARLTVSYACAIRNTRLATNWKSDKLLVVSSAIFLGVLLLVFSIALQWVTTDSTSSDVDQAANASIGSLSGPTPTFQNAVPAPSPTRAESAHPPGPATDSNPVLVPAKESAS